MEEVTIAVIQHNDIVFSDIEQYVKPLLYRDLDKLTRQQLKNQLDTYIWSVMQPFVNFVTVPMCKVVDTACEKIIQSFNKEPQQLFYHTESSYSFSKGIIEFVYAQINQGGEVELLPKNTIGCLMSLKHSFIQNTCVVLFNSYDLTAPKFVKLSNISQKELIAVIRRRFFHSAIVVPVNFPNNDLIKVYYQKTEYLLGAVFLNNSDKTDVFHCDIIKHNLLVYHLKTPLESQFETDDLSHVINKFATRICGTKRIYGNVLIINEMDSNIPANLSLTDIKNIDMIAHGRLYDRSLKNNETTTEEIVEIDSSGQENTVNKVPFWGRYIAMKNRIENNLLKNNICIYCGNYGDVSKKLYYCTGCYRVKYCSIQCQKLDYVAYHKNDCSK